MKFAATRLALTALTAAHLIVTIWQGELRRVGAAHARFALSAAIRALIDLASALGAAFVLGWHHAVGSGDSA